MYRSAPTEFLGKVHFIPNVPDKLKGLKELSENLWWTWNPRARELFRKIDLPTWITTNGNAVRFLRNVSQERLDHAAQDPELLEYYDEVIGSFEEYKSAKKSWWHQRHGAKKETLVAYFSAEYGLHEILQIYSGGLGVLSGDHLKSSSDLGIPMIAIGLLYHDGYFQQQIDEHGQQVAVYNTQKWEELPVFPVMTKSGEEMKIRIEFPGRLITAKIWQINVGRVPIYMMDTDLSENIENDRKLTSRLYGGDQETRIQQEIILGMGGVKTIRALLKEEVIDREPTLYHMNEGHSAFLSLERLRNYMLIDGLSLPESLEVIRSSSLFTTHTPVPAGHDRFPLGLVDKYFRGYYESIQLTRSEFIEFGVEPMPDGQQLFSMTILALSFAAMANGVSRLHGEVSKKMMAPIWRDVPVAEIPIGYITNGVHTRTWMGFDFQNLFDKYLGPDWRNRIIHEDMWSQAIETIPDEELWATMGHVKQDLIEFIHTRLRSQHTRFGEMPDEIDKVDEVFTANALTIGFARRFATYKRAVLLFRDPDRLARIVNNPERPVQFVFAGKAHPADEAGQAFIRKIIEFSKDDRFRNRLVFVENYDMNIGRRLTSGVDVWLNNPRRPNEASGTSGMKVPLNGGLNCSILDGWWPEAYEKNPESGFVIGYEKDYEDQDKQDAEDAETLYRVLEKEIVPTYYNVDKDNVPREWLNLVKESMKTVGPNFNTDRMVTEYTTNYYLRGSDRFVELTKKSFEEARQYAKKKDELRHAWSQIHVNAFILSEMPEGTDMYSAPVKQEIKVEARVTIGSLSLDQVIVEIYAEELRPENGSLPNYNRFPMKLEKSVKEDGQDVHIFKGDFVMAESGEHGFTVRVLPNDDKLFDPHEMGLVRWAEVSKRNASY